jgi:uncharacterized protein DUF6941
MPFETGPYLSAAVLCERVLEEKDGVVTLVRLVDRLLIASQGPEAPSTLPPTTISLVAVIWLRSGEARGSHTLKIRPELPSGQSLDAPQVTIHLEGEERGTRSVFNLNLVAEQEGLYWFDVLFDDNLLTRIPFRIIYQRMTAGA